MAATFLIVDPPSASRDFTSANLFAFGVGISRSAARLKVFANILSIILWS